MPYHINPYKYWLCTFLNPKPTPTPTNRFRQKLKNHDNAKCDNKFENNQLWK